MNAETLKDFLISLGFSVDEAGAKKFDSVVAGTTLKAIELGVKVEAAALSVVAFTAKIASGLDNLYWASQRTGATVNGIKQIGYAISQVGGTVDGARGSLESLARFVRNNPGAEGFLNRLGVQTRDAKGNMRDMASIFTGVGQRLSSMPYYRANQYAQMLGIDENTLMAMRRGIGQFSGEYTAMAKAIGYNADTAAVSSNRFMTSLRSFGQMAGMARDKIGSNLAGGLAGSIDTLRRQILDNFPRIEGAITATVKGILWVGEIIGRVIYRLIQAAESVNHWWGTLDKNTRGFIELIGGLVVAWWLLNKAMLASPITRTLSLVAAIGLLWEDYQTWKEGGKSLIDWGKWKDEIDAASQLIGDLKNTVNDLAGVLAKLLNIDPKSWSMAWDLKNVIGQMGELGKMLSHIAELLNAVNEGRWADAAKIAGTLFNQGKDKPDALPTVTDSANRTSDLIKEHTGFDTRSVGRTVRGWFGEQQSPQIDNLNRTQEKARNEAADYHRQSGGALGAIADGIGKIVDTLFPPAAAAEITPALVTAPVNANAAGDAGAGRRGERNNNPGNLNYAGQFGATPERPGGRFARFETAFDGLRALSRQLVLYAGRGINSVEKIISTWAPPSDNNNTTAYIQSVAKNLGVNPRAALNMSDPQTMSALMSSIVHHENGRNIYSNELINKAAVAGMGKSARIDQHNTYHIYGGNAQEIGQEVSRRQTDVNARIMRTNQPGVG